MRALIWMAAALLLLDLAPAPALAGDGVVVARVGGQVITAAELGRELRQGIARRDPDAPIEAERPAVLEALIERKLLVQAAIDAGYLEDPGVRYALEGLLVQRFRQEHLDPALAAVAVDAGEIEAFYQANREVYRIPPARRTAVLQLAGNGADAAARAVAVRERAVALKTADFGALAAELSHDRATRYRGGDMGELVQGVEYRWPPAVVAGAFALERVGDISAPIEADGSLWLVKLTAADKESFRPLEEVATTIRYELVRRKQRQHFADVVASLRESIGVAIDQAALEAVEIPPPPVPPSLPAGTDDTP